MRRVFLRTPAIPLASNAGTPNRDGALIHVTHSANFNIFNYLWPRRSFTLSRSIAQLWLVLLSWSPSPAPAGMIGSPSLYAGLSYPISTLSSGLLPAGSAASASAAVGGALEPTLLLLVGAGFISRVLFLLPWSILGDRALDRLAVAMPDLIRIFQDYKRIASHPMAIGWEKKVALSKLKRERKRVFALNGTGSLRSNTYHLLAASLGLYFILWPAQAVSTVLIDRAGGAPIGPLLPLAPLLGDAAGDVVLGTIAHLDMAVLMGLGLTTFNTLAAIERRRGFSDKIDRNLDKARRGVVAVAAAALALTWGVPVALALLAKAAAGALPALGGVPYFTVISTGPAGGAGVLPLVPFHVPAYALGLAAGGLLQHIVYRSPLLRHVLDFPPTRPPTHGQYGGASTGAILERLGQEPIIQTNHARDGSGSGDSGGPSADDASGPQQRRSFFLDDAERAEQWRKHKLLLEFECNIKIYQLLKKVGLMTNDDDFERDREILEEKVAAAHRLHSKDNNGNNNNSNNISIPDIADAAQHVAGGADINPTIVAATAAASLGSKSGPGRQP